MYQMCMSLHGFKTSNERCESFKNAGIVKKVGFIGTLSIEFQNMREIEETRYLYIPTNAYHCLRHKMTRLIFFMAANLSSRSREVSKEKSVKNITIRNGY